MSNNKITTLCNHLEQEITWIEALNTLLADEKKLLETRQFQPLEDCANKKQDLSSKLEESAKERMTLINKTDQSAKTALEEFLEECTEAEVNQVNALNSKLADALTHCRELNTVNGQVIANNLYVRQEIVNALSGDKADAVSVYNSHGDLKSANDNRHHQKA